MIKKEKVRHHKRICKGDKVYVIAGNERGQTGTVLKHRGDTVLVQGLKIQKKHVKKSEQNPKGGIMEREGPIHISNVKLFVGESKPVKVRTTVGKKGERNLVYKDGEKDVVYRPVRKRTT